MMVWPLSVAKALFQYKDRLSMNEDPYDRFSQNIFVPGMGIFTTISSLWLR